MPIDPVILQLKADVDSYNAKVTGAQRLTDQKLSAIEAKGFAMGQSLKRGFTLASVAATAFASSIVIGAITNAISKGLDYASSLGEQAQQLGITTDALQEYRFAATQVGLSSDEMDQAISQLTRRIGEAASGTKAQTEAFEKLGVSIRDSNGNIKSAADIIPEIADGYQRLGSEAERTAVGTDLFGKSAFKLGPLLAGGSAAINNLRDAAHKLGAVISPDLIARADETADKLSALKTILSAQIASAVAANSNAILGLANALVTLVTWLGQAGEAYRRFTILNNQFAAGLTIGSPWASPLAKQQAMQQVNRDAGSEQERQVNAMLDRAGLGRSSLAGLAKPAGAGSAAVGGIKPVTAAGAAGPTGPTAAETASRYEDQLRQITGQILSALEQQATTADERAEIQLRALEFDRIASKQEITHDKNYTAAQKEDLLAANERLADRGREMVEHERRVAIEREATDLAAVENRAQTEALGLQLDLADTQADRKRIALDILGLEERYQRSLLEGVIASEAATEAEKERARVALAALAEASAAKRESVSRANETQVERYLRDLRKSPDQINEAIDGIKIDGLEALNDGLVDAITGAKSLGAVFKDVSRQIIADLLRIAIQQAVIKPLAESLFGGSGGGGLFGSLLGFAGGIGGGTSAGGGGRAGGGYVGPGQWHRVNEGASPGRVEAFMSRDGGRIIPLGAMNALRSSQQGGGMATVRLELSGDIDARIQSVSGPVAIEVYRAAAPTMIDASARETLRRAGRSKL